MASGVDAKLLKQTKFPPEFSQKVDIKKLNVEVMKKWIASRIAEILGNDDDVVTELCFNLLEGSRYPDIKVLQISLTGFLDKDTAKFCKELWNLCLSAQSNPQGVPKELLEAKKLELIQEKVDAEKAVEEARQRKEKDSLKDRDVEAVRQRERADRADRGDRGDRGRGRRGVGRGARFFEPRGRRDSQSPPRRRPSPDRRPVPRREADTYVPQDRLGRRTGDRRRSHTRSLSRSRSSSPSSSRSPSPPRRRPGSPSAWSRSPKLYRPARSLSRSRSPPRRRNERRRRSPSPRAERPARRRSTSSFPSSSSLSPSPPRNLRRRRRSPSRSPSKSGSGDRSRRNVRRRPSPRRSPSHESRDHRRLSRADVVKDRPARDGRRLSRSWDRHAGKRAQSLSRSPNRSRSRSTSRSRRVRGNHRGRRRSLERWAPVARKRRNSSSSVSSPDDKRRKIANASDHEGSAARPQSRGSIDVVMSTNSPKEIAKVPSEATTPASHRIVPKLTANELREKVLREKIKASRKTSTDS